MASKKSEHNAGVEVVEQERNPLEVRRPVHPAEDASDEFHKRQAEELLRYRVDGKVGLYIDQSRDQEPDIAPELGVAPHPELANPAPPDIRGLGIGESTKTPTTRTSEENPDTADEAARAAEEALLEGAAAGPPAMPVRVVADESDGRVEAPEDAAVEAGRARAEASEDSKE